jgi:hypothetical protein
MTLPKIIVALGVQVSCHELTFRMSIFNVVVVILTVAATTSLKFHRIPIRITVDTKVKGHDGRQVYKVVES